MLSSSRTDPLPSRREMSLNETSLQVNEQEFRLMRGPLLVVVVPEEVVDGEVGTVDLMVMLVRMRDAAVSREKRE